MFGQDILRGSTPAWRKWAKFSGWKDYRQTRTLQAMFRTTFELFFQIWSLSKIQRKKKFMTSYKKPCSICTLVFLQSRARLKIVSVDTYLILVKYILILKIYEHIHPCNGLKRALFFPNCCPLIHSWLVLPMQCSMRGLRIMITVI